MNTFEAVDTKVLEELTNAERDLLLIKEAQERHAQIRSVETDFTSDELHGALLRTEDTMGRSLANYVLLGDTAKAIVDDKTGYAKLYGDKVHLGMRRTAVTKFFMDTIRMLEGDTLDVEDNRLTFVFNGVPIVIDIIDNDMGYFERPDQRWYFVTNFPVPNSFGEYWKNKDRLR